MPIPCSECGARNAVDIPLDEDSPTWVCGNGHSNHGDFSLDFTVGRRILVKSHYELTAREDFSMSIVLSATAFECEIASLFAKWKRVESSLAGKTLADEEIEDQYRKLYKIVDKIERTATFLNPMGIDGYVSDSSEFQETVTNGFPSLTIGSLAKNFEEFVFWPRNRILHFGQSRYAKADADRCYSIASLGLDIFSKLDKCKYNSVFSANINTYLIVTA